MLGNPTESPYGNPIPGLAEIGGPTAGQFLDGVQNIVAATDGTDAVAVGVVRRLGEPVQFEPELLHQLRTAGVMPGRVARVQRAGAYVAVRVDGEDAGIELPTEVAQHVYIERD
jgi:DtxR family Mn-dependent transcriptional regulator